MSHMTLSDRIIIESSLNENQSFKFIATEIGKNPSSITREIRKHITLVDTYGAYRIKNRCIHRKNCHISFLCNDKPDCTKICSRCSMCNSHCNNFVEEKCSRLNSAPYVCNGCEDKHKCVLLKHFYYAKSADKQYHEGLREYRTGYNMTTGELRQIDEIVSPLLKQGQSIHFISITNADKLPVSSSTISRLVKDRMLTATVMDQQRVVKLKPRKSKRPDKKVDRKCRINRTMDDYLDYINKNPHVSTVQCDTVIGTVGGKCLLTLLFTESNLMLAFLCDYHTAACVKSKFEFLYNGLGDQFNILFPVILTDNGSEFSDPSSLETAPDGSKRTSIFYCDPMASWQKGQVERNHEFIRMFLPKGSSFDNLTQDNINLMMSHINSYKRPSLGNRSPFEMFAFIYGQSTLDKVLRLTCQTIIDPNNIILKSILFR